MKKPTLALLITLSVTTLALTACDSSPVEMVEQIKAVATDITEEKYPIANMPDEPLATPLEINIEPKRLATDGSWSIGIKDNGTVWEWGAGNPTPTMVQGINEATSVVVGDGHALVLRKKDGSVWGWGSNGNGEINPNIESSLYKPIPLQKIEGIDNVIDFDATAYSSVFLTKNGEVYIISKKNQYPSDCNEFNVCKIKFFDDINVVKIQGSISSLLALDDKGNLYATGFFPKDLGRFDDEAELPTYSKTKDLFPVGKVDLPKKVVDFSYGLGNFALLEDGTLWSWGNGISAITAQGNRDITLKPKRVQGLSKVTHFNSTSAYTEYGDVYIWGDYTYGNNISTSRDYIVHPTLIKSNIQTSQYIQGSENGFLSSDGSAWFWGSNFEGQFGTGKTQSARFVSKDETLIPQKSLFNIH